MFDWVLFEALEMYLKYLTHCELQMPDLVLFHLLRMCFAFISVVVIAAFWTIQYSDHITVIFDNTINLMLEFQVSLQQVMGPEGVHQQTSELYEHYWSLFTSSILSNAPQLELLLVPGVLYLTHAAFMCLVNQWHFGITSLRHLTGEGF